MRDRWLKIVTKKWHAKKRYTRKYGRKRNKRIVRKYFSDFLFRESLQFRFQIFDQNPIIYMICPVKLTLIHLNQELKFFFLQRRI